MQGLSNYFGGTGGYDPNGPNTPGAAPGHFAPGGGGLLGNSGLFSSPTGNSIGAILNQLLQSRGGLGGLGSSALGLPGSGTGPKPVLAYPDVANAGGGKGLLSGLLSGRSMGGQGGGGSGAAGQAVASYFL